MLECVKCKYSGTGQYFTKDTIDYYCPKCFIELLGEEKDNAKAKLEEELNKSIIHLEKLQTENKLDDAHIQQAYIFGLNFSLKILKKEMDICQWKNTIKMK